jgi:hypothetical protein
MFYLRASELLQGLCSHLETRHPFMHTMAAAARLAFLDRHPLPTRLQPAAPVAPRLPVALLRDAGAAQRACEEELAAAAAASTLAAAAASAASGAAGRSEGERLEARLRARLAVLHSAGAFTGCQVAVLRRDTRALAEAGAGYSRPQVVACVAAGQCGALDPRPVTPATLFPVLGASRVGVAAAAAYVAATGSNSNADVPSSASAAAARAPQLLDLDREAVATYWPAFAARGKGACSVGELLRGRSGIEGVLPPNLSTASLSRSRWAEGAALVAGAAPLLLPRMALRLRADGSAGVGGEASEAGPEAAEGGEEDEDEVGLGAGSHGEAAAAGEGASAGAAPATPLLVGAKAALPALPEQAEDREEEGEGDAGAATAASSAPQAGAAAVATAPASAAAPSDAAAALPPTAPQRARAAAAAAAFSEVPAPLLDCFLQESGLPSVGPDARTELTSHLWLGWGWAAGQTLASMASKAALHGVKADQGATALTSLLAEGVEPRIGLAGHAAFGAITQAEAEAMAAAAASVGAGSKPAVKAAAPAAPTAPVHPADTVGPAAGALISRFAAVCLGPGGALAGAPEEGAQAAGSAASAAAEAGEGASPAAVEEEEAAASGSGEDNEVTVASAMAAMELAEAMGRGGLTDLTTLTAGGREHFMDPRLVNVLKLRGSLLPSLGLYASALGLAHLLDYAGAVHVAALHARMAGAGSSGWRAAVAALSAPAGAAAAFTCEDPTAALRRGGPRATRLLDLRALWAAHYSGLRLLGFKHRPQQAQDGKAAGVVLLSGFGCAALGGSLVMCDAVTGVTVAITVNRLAADRALTRHLFDIVAEEMALGTALRADV